MAQIVYYFSSALWLARLIVKCLFSVQRAISVILFAGYLAKKRALPIDQLVVATKQERYFAFVDYQNEHESSVVECTLSPSMNNYGYRAT